MKTPVTLLTAVAVASLALLQAAPAHADTWLCDYTGSYTSAGSAGATDFKWQAHWDTSADGYRIGGQFTDATGTAIMDGTCKSGKCWASWNYQSGKYAGKKWYVGGPYADGAGGQSTLTFTWGRSVSDVTSGGTFNASGVCRKQ